jgi:hypothetical protein
MVGPRQSCAETPVGPRPSRSPCRRKGARELGDGSRSEAIVGQLTRFPGQAVLSRHIGMEESQGRSAHTSQRCPPGSWKFAVRIPHGRSIGPLSMRTPRCASCRQRASTSSTLIVNWTRWPADGAAIAPGPSRLGAASTSRRRPLREYADRESTRRRDAASRAEAGLPAESNYARDGVEGGV